MNWTIAGLSEEATFVFRSAWQRLVDAGGREAGLLSAYHSSKLDESNYTEVIQQIEALLSRKNVPTKKVEADVPQTLRDYVINQAPEGTTMIIVARYKEDASDPTTDYFSNKTTREIPIAYWNGKRESFPAMRRAAAKFTGTAHMDMNAPKTIEHRDRFAGGTGNYLSDHGSDRAGTGWVVRMEPLPCRWLRPTELFHQGLGLPEFNRHVHVPVVEPVVDDPVDEPVNEEPVESIGLAQHYVINDVTVRPSEIREGWVELVFPGKPDKPIRTELKDAHYRFNPKTSIWYGRLDDLPERYK